MDKVSIITPVYNCERYIRQTINSVLEQTYEEWELILVDDCSPDGSKEIIKQYQKNDSRIRYVRLKNNRGAALARNVGLKVSTGRFVAYLDADDVWLPCKLEKQVKFMKDNDLQFSCCDYEEIDENGESLNKIVHMPKTITYNQLLRNTIIQTVGVIADTDKVDKRLLVMPNVRRGQDSATWLKMLRNGVSFVGQNEVLAQYRRAPGSLSSNKFKAMKRTWYLYRKVEKLSLIKSASCMIGWAYHACAKRVYLKKRTID